MSAIRQLADLSRAELARLGREVELLSIAEWKGASPNYTRRMKRLMGIEGDDVAAIVKAFQLDVEFPHEYMDVRFEIRVEAIARPVDPRARVRAGPDHTFAIKVDPKAEPAQQPQSAALTRLSTIAASRFRDPG